MPKVSVIIPTYNCEKYICEAIDSVLNQTFQDFEIIVVNDGSTDNTKDVLAKYNGRIRYFYQENKGVSSARNMGIKEANGEYIAFLDSDDMWLKDKLKTQVKILDSRSEVTLVYGRAKRIDQHGIVLDIKPTYPAIDAEGLLEGNRISTMTVMARKACFEEVGLFDKTIIVGEDTDMWIRIALRYKIVFLNEIQAIYRFHGGNISNNMEEAYKGHIKILKKLFFQEVVNQFSKKNLKNLLSKEYYSLARIYFHKQMKYKLALKFALLSFRYNPMVGMNFISKKDNLILKLIRILKPYGLLINSFYKNIIIKNG